MYSFQLFPADPFGDFDATFKRITSAINKSNNQFEQIIDNSICLPINEYKEEDGTEVIEMAAVGLSLDNIKVTANIEDGISKLTIKIDRPEPSEDEKKTEENRKYTVQKIKFLKNDEYVITLPAKLDVKQAKRTLVNGLLTVRIPMKEEEKPVEITIE